jgi:hypothetical protein
MDDKAENHNGRPEHMGHPERLIGNEMLYGYSMGVVEMKKGMSGNEARRPQLIK